MKFLPSVVSELNSIPLVVEIKLAKSISDSLDDRREEDEEV